MPRYESVWIATSEEPGFGALEAPIEVDVAVLGAGIAGLTTALLLKNAGLRVAVVEAAGVSRATTGHTTAKVSAQHGLIYDTLSSKFGNDGARAYGQANLAAVDLVEALVREHGIACDWERRAAYAYTEQDSQVSQIEREVDAARQAGLPASYTEETDLPWSVKAAVRFDNHAQFHPRRYCLALATLVDGDGSRVFEQTRALDVEDGSPCVVKTEHHDVRAAFVVLATHLPFLDQGAFFAKCHPEREYVLAAALKQPVPKGMYISVEQPTRSIRQHPFDGGELLILGGDSHKTGQDDDTEKHYTALEEFASERFAVRSIEYRWSTQDQMSVDHVPYIGKLRRTSDRLYVATGFNKWGMTSGTLAGVVITDQILGRDNPWIELFDPNRVKPLASAKEFTKENINVARRFVGDRITQRAPLSIEQLAPGEGQVASVGGQAGRGIARRGRERARCFRALHAPGLHRQLEPRRAHVGLPLPRLTLRSERHRRYAFQQRRSIVAEQRRSKPHANSQCAGVYRRASIHAASPPRNGRAPCPSRYSRRHLAEHWSCWPLPMARELG